MPLPLPQGWDTELEWLQYADSALKGGGWLVSGRHAEMLRLLVNERLEEEGVEGRPCPVTQVYGPVEHGRPHVFKPGIFEALAKMPKPPEHGD